VLHVHDVTLCELVNLLPEWQRKPIAFVGWGNVGGARAIEQLRLAAARAREQR
jgi:NAD(P)H-dependent FMN reductase